MCIGFCNSILASDAFILFPLLQTKFLLVWISSKRPGPFIFMFYLDVSNDSIVYGHCTVSTLGNSHWYSWHAIWNIFLFPYCVFLPKDPGCYTMQSHKAYPKYIYFLPFLFFQELYLFCCTFLPIILYTLFLKYFLK